MAPWRGADLTQALERVGVPAYMLATDGVFTWQNAAAREVFGNLAGKHYSAVIVPEELPKVREQFARKIVGGEATEYRTVVRMPDGRRIPVEISSVPLAGGGHCHGVFGLAVVDEPAAPPPKVRELTPRQHQVLQLLAAGLSTDQIAATLTISSETVRNHVRHILRALGAHSRLEAVATARRAGLLHDG
ncbi:MAG: PAS domain S-box protein [Actinobacteria bacterium]|nr:MAG: PAS domain S-box protein [Actinomycetota bacterium]